MVNIILLKSYYVLLSNISHKNIDHKSILNDKGTLFIRTSFSKNAIAYFDSHGIENIDLTVEKYFQIYKKHPFDY